jgi:hypothetical protein
MSYSDFTLKRVKEELQINVVENRDIFSHIKETEVSEILLTILKYNVPLAVAIGTEKARSEMIIVNVLIEVKRILEEKISLFSGINFEVDKARSLNGFCDFMISKSPEQFYLNAPVIAIVESKDDKTTSGLGQCVAEMYASSIFNEKDELQLPIIYGAITTGSNWRFLKYKDHTAFIDLNEYSIENTRKIVGILVDMVNQNA